MSLEKRPEHFFLEKCEVTGQQLDRIVRQILGGNVDYADLYFEHTRYEIITFEQGKVKSGAGDVVHGVGVRAVAGDKMGFASTNKISIKELVVKAREAKYIAAHGSSVDSAFSGVSLEAREPHNLYSLQDSPIAVPFGERKRLLELVDQECRAYDPKIREVFVNLGVEDKRVMIVGRDGWMVGDTRPLVRLNVTCIAQDQAGRSESGSYGGGGRVSYAYFLEEDRYRHFAREAARQAIVNLTAIEAPAGPMEVVLGPGWPGILLHEAIGHGLEGDFNRKKLSAFTGRLGQKVASELCTVIDDGTIPERRGSLNVDDEGTPTSRTVLIEKGILCGYLQDKLNAKLMGMQLTGNGRRESYAHYPMPRMTNTFMLPGDASPEDIIRSVKKGIYAVSFSGGQVDITNGKFVFSASEAYLIEDGKITTPVKRATLIGNGPDVLTKVLMVGNDFELDPGVGTCGKDGQSVPVGVGLPTILVKEITVGGTNTKFSKGGFMQ